MARATILHVGDDGCHRILVMQRAGFVVHTSTCTVDGVRRALARRKGLEAITFGRDHEPLPVEVVTTVRTLFDAPLVLFENSAFEYEQSGFDLIIPTLTSPTAWLQRLRDVIEAAKKLHATSRKLRQECADVRAATRALRERSARNRVDPIDLNELWRGTPGKDD